MSNTQNTERFADLGIANGLLQTLTTKGFVTPTPIQHQVIPSGLQGHDVIGIAQTGTGKTLAFGIPMIQKILSTKGQGLILVPTRELALQVDKALFSLGKEHGLKTAVIIGGVSQRQQERALQRNPQLIIATPGRLDDLMGQGLYNLSRVSVIALDEADRMLDVGFLPQIKHILQTAPSNKQVLLFSATMSKSISQLAEKFMEQPLRVEIAPQGTSSKNIEQELFIVRKDKKMNLLATLLDEYKEDTVLVFSRTKHGAKKVAAKIRGLGHTATEIHGNRSQNQRKHAIEGFTNKKYRVMVATDIAARGIDVSHISLVINMDLPDSIEDYVHRIGRTGRAGRSGKAISFVMPSERRVIKRIERLIKKSIVIQKTPDLPEMEFESKAEPKPARQGFGGGRGRSSRQGEGGGRDRNGRRGGRRGSNRAFKSGSKGQFGRNKRHNRRRSSVQA